MAKHKFELLSALICVSLLLSGCSGGAEENSGNKAEETTERSTVPLLTVPEDTKTVIAWVEGQDDPIFDITFSDWYQEYKFYLLRYGKDDTDPAQAEECKALRGEIIKVLQQDRMLLKEAELAGVGVNDLTQADMERLDQTLQESYQSWCDSFEEDAVKILGDDYTEQELYDTEYQLFTDFLAQAGTTTDMFVMWERNNIIQDKLYAKLTEDAGITDSKVEDYVNEKIQEAKNAYENDLETYESAYTAFYIPEGTRVVEQIFFKFDTVTANEIIAYRNDGDDETADALLKEAVEKQLAEEIEKAQQELADGKEWDEVQVIYNDDANGNDETYVVYPKSTKVDPKVTEAAMAMKKPGDVSEVITTDYGCYLLYYLRDNSFSDDDLEKMKEQCRDYLVSQYVQETVNGWREKYPYTVNYELIGVDQPS